MTTITGSSIADPERFQWDQEDSTATKAVKFTAGKAAATKAAISRSFRESAQKLGMPMFKDEGFLDPDTAFSMMGFLSPKDRAAAAPISRSFRKSAQKAGEIHFKALTGSAPKGLANRQVHELNAHLKGAIRSYPTDQVPKEIGEIIGRTLSIQATQTLQKFVKARDTLVVWQELAKAISNNEDFTGSFDRVGDAIKKAGDFSEWMQANQNALNQLEQLLLDNNQLTTLPEEIGGLTQLLGLNLNNNQLTTLPKEIGGLTQLNLSLSNNPLRCKYKIFEMCTSEVINAAALVGTVAIALISAALLRNSANS